MKVAVVGGGSTYTPELVDGIARLQHLIEVDELVLTDPAEDRLALVGGMSQRIFAKYRSSSRVTFTTDLDEALAGAAIVLIQLRVGGQAARAIDETLPLQMWSRWSGDYWCRRAGKGAAYGAGDLGDR